MHLRVSGGSMEPGFPDGSVVFASSLVYRFRQPRPGDVVVAEDLRDGRLILKRVTKVESGKYFLMGDNKDKSTDSRKFGETDRSAVKAKVLFRYLKNRREWLLAGLILFALVGVIDSSYLTYSHFSNTHVVCGVDAASCDIVTSSSYSVIFGLPVALYGLFFYVATLLGAILISKGAIRLVRPMQVWTGIGFAASLYFVYLQAFVIGAFCTFCLISAGTATAMFGLGLLLSRSGKGRKVN